MSNFLQRFYDGFRVGTPEKMSGLLPHHHFGSGYIVMETRHDGRSVLVLLTSDNYDRHSDGV